MNKTLISVACALALLPVVPVARANNMVFPKTILKFHTMVGNTSPYIAAYPVAIRGILGGPKPWDLTRAVGELKSDGTLHIEIKGLIIPASVPGFGFNPAKYFQAVVSCRTLAPHGGTYYKNLVTPKADTRMIGNYKLGNAVIDGKVSLPDPCIAPIVFVTSPAFKNPPTGYWFAATGYESGSN